MISNENSSYYNRSRPGYGYPQTTSHFVKPHLVEETVKSETLQIERKIFIIALKENPRGRFMRITEDAEGRRNSVIVPASGIQDFARIIETLAKAAADLPPPKVAE